MQNRYEMYHCKYCLGFLIQYLTSYARYLNISQNLPPHGTLQKKSKGGEKKKGKEKNGGK